VLSTVPTRIAAPEAERAAAKLWPHQAEAVSMIERALGPGGRSTVIAACGTGKTRIGDAAAERLRAQRRLVVLPTIELLAQTVRAYRATARGGLGMVIAVCSDPTVADKRVLDEETDMVVTTTPEVLADHLRRWQGPVTVMSTYASLPVVVAAHERHGLTDRWDLVIADEAHRTTGRQAGLWQVVHHDHLLPARRRLYMTATPRVTGTNGDQVASMSDPSIYGQTCYRLPFSAAIDKGLLADYRVVVPVVTNAEVHRLASDPNLRLRMGRSAVSPQILAGQIAVLRAMTDYNARRAITYHHRIADASRWSTSLPLAAALMPDWKQDLWAGHVHGEQHPRERRKVLGRLAEPSSRLVLVSNAKLLTEGIDVPAVDAVAFQSPRNDAIGTIQAVGRALRTGGRVGKVATVIVPLLLADGETPETALDDSAWAPVWQILRALRDHDDRLDNLLRQGRTRLGEGTLTTGDDGAKDSLPPWLAVTGVEVPPDFARSIHVHALRSATSIWDEMFGAARAYRAEHGHLLIPATFVTSDGRRLGEWSTRQRHQYHKGELPPPRYDTLTALGMVWSLDAEKWARWYEAARQFYETHGHLVAPTGPLQTWLKNQRKRRVSGKIEPWQVELLDKIGMIWNPSNDSWMRNFEELRLHHAEHGNIDIPSGTKLDRWLRAQFKRHHAGTLDEYQFNLLSQLGMRWDHYGVRERWRARYMEAARSYYVEYGHLNVPSSYVTPDGLGLGKWLVEQRIRRSKGLLEEHDIAKLDELEFEWSGIDGEWMANFGEARRHYEENGSLTAAAGTKLDKWSRLQVRRRSDGSLKKQQLHLLDKIGLV